MSKPWGGAGAWALEAERAEAEERELAASAAAAAAPTPLSQTPQSFPSLKEAAAAKPKKKKPVPIPLTQFVADPHAGLTHDEILRLPTGPRERGPDEFEFSGRRGFSSSYSAGGGMRRGGGGFDDETRRNPPPPRASDMDLPSRADEVDNWAAGKKQFAPVDHGPRYGSLGGSSRADDVDNWAAGKKPAQSFGSGHRSSYGGGGSSDSDRWARGVVVVGGGFSSSNGERKRLVLDPPKKDEGGAGNESARSQTRASPFGAARPREEVLAEKGLDWRKIDSEIETKKAISRPTSSHSSRPSSAQSSRPGTPGAQMGGVRTQVRSKVNPFGDAKPREVLLQAQGKDWRKIDLELEHRRVDRPETDEEKQFKEEINYLKSQEENLKSENAQDSVEDLAALQEKILHRERQLEHLIRQLDDKVRFGQRAAGGNTRPTSGAGRIGGPLDARPHSRSGVSEESRSSEFMERPRSRGGMADTWTRPMDDRRRFQSGYFGDRNLNRPKSGERW